MRKIYFLLAFMLVFAIACQSPQEKCEKPFAKIGSKCCLDLDKNDKCDKDESDPSEEAVINASAQSEVDNSSVSFDEKKFFAAMDVIITLSSKITKISNIRVQEYAAYMKKVDMHDTAFCPKLKEIADDRNKVVEQLNRISPPAALAEYYSIILETSRLKFQSSEAMYNTCMAGSSDEKADFAQQSIDYVKQASEKRKEYTAMREQLLKTYG